MIANIHKQISDFKGHTIHDSINVEKYKALAYMSPKGSLLYSKVLKNWNTWINKVADAPWLRQWTRSKLWGLRGSLPSGCDIDWIGEVEVSQIALGIYVEAVWSIGIENKINDSKFLLEHMNKLRGARCSTFMWDPDFQKKNILVPSEIGELDKWLEPMWLECTLK